MIQVLVFQDSTACWILLTKRVWKDLRGKVLNTLLLLCPSSKQSRKVRKPPLPRPKTIVKQDCVLAVRKQSYNEAKKNLGRCGLQQLPRNCFLKSIDPPLGPIR